LNQHIEADKSTTKDLDLKQTSIKAWRITGWISLAAWNGFPFLDLFMEESSV
jgi:hypothetical protein